MQQVPSTPAHCLACSTLPQQTLLIIDVLEWPHHHWILPSGRIIKVITATLTYLLYCNSGSGISSREMDFLKLLGDYTGFILFLISVYVPLVWKMEVIYFLPDKLQVSYLIRATFLYHIFNPYLCEQFKNTFYI